MIYFLSALFIISVPAGGVDAVRQWRVATDENIWVLKEADIPYGQKTGQENCANSVF